MSERYLTLAKLREYIKSKDMNTAYDLVQYVTSNPVTQEMIDIAIESARSSGRKTVQLKDLPPAESLGRDRMDLIKRRWGKPSEPLRKIVLWGWDDKNNPSFAIFFGHHKFEEGNKIQLREEDIKTYHESINDELKPEISPGRYLILQKDVEYIGYTILHGNGGHLPSNIDFKLLQPRHYDYRRRETIYEQPFLVNRKGLYKQYISQRRSYYYRRGTMLREVAPFVDLNTHEKFSFPYYEELNYSDYVKEIEKRNIFEGLFKVAENPNDVLNLNKDIKDYLNLLIEVTSNQNLIQRKKFLNILIERNPPKLVYETILQIGSSDLISGLLLELAKREDPILKEEIETLLSSGIRWTHPKYVKGIKRCAEIYLNSINHPLKEKRVNEIQNLVSKIELIAVHGATPRKRRGGYLKKREKDMSYNDYVKIWGSDEWLEFGHSIIFSPNIISDGRNLAHVKLKSLIQEAEVYNLPKVVGILAYQIDSPKFYYFMKSSEYFGFYIYLRRYIRRIIDDYAQNNEDAFIKALKSFLITYKTNDIITIRYPYRTPMILNEILTHYLIKPVSYRSSSHDHGYYGYYSHGYYRERPAIDSADFKFTKSLKDFQNREEILKKHLIDVIEIAALAEAHIILEFCFNIISGHPDLDDAVGKISYKNLIQLSLSKHSKLANLFKEKFSEIISKSRDFNPHLMIALMEAPDIALQDQAREYYKKTKGKFAPESIVELMLLENIENWIEFVEERIKELHGHQYLEFINSFVNNIYLFEKIELPEIIFDVLNSSTDNINELEYEEKLNLFKQLLDLLIHESKLSEWASTYFQNLVFSISYDDLIKVVKSADIDLERYPTLTLRSLVKALSTGLVPSNTEILNILELGTSKMVKTLITLIEKNKDQLVNRLNTLLLLYESEVAPLNNIAENIVDNLDKKELNKVLSLLIDSPLNRVHLSAVNKVDKIYDGKIPKNFIIQMLEHGSPEIKAYISNKIEKIIEDVSKGNIDLFLYYMNTLLYLPNLKSKSKDKFYELIPSFVLSNKQIYSEVENVLIDIGGSNIIKDSERALVALAKIKKEVN